MRRAWAVCLLGFLSACTIEDRLDPVPDSGRIERDATAMQNADARADAGVAPDDADVEADAEPGDGGAQPDASADAGIADSGEVCGLGELGDPDRARMMLIGHSFTAQPGVDGTQIESFSIAMAGGPVGDGMVLDVGTRPIRIAFTPSGTLALVLGEDGTLVSVATDSVDTLAIKDTITLFPAGFEDLVITADGRTAYAIGSDVGAQSGVSTVHIGCDGTLTRDDGAFFNVRLAESLALIPGSNDQRAVLLGGQAVFEPVDVNDLRLIERTGSGWNELGAFDIFMDFIDAGKIGISPDGTLVLVPNGSPFSTEGGHVALVGISGNMLSEVDRYTGLDDAREAIFAPDGRTALISQLQPGRVAILSDLGSGLQEAGSVTGIGLADQMAMISRGMLSGRVYIPSIDPQGGPNIAMLSIDAPGIVANLGQFELGNGSENIAVAIAVTP